MYPFSTGVSAIRANQVALNTIAQNISNANTPGYHRQVARFTDRAPVERDNLSLGTGVDIARIQRTRDQVVEATLTRNISLLADAETRLETAQRIETLLAPGRGALNERLEGFFNEFERLSGAPEDQAQRLALLNSAQALGREFQTLSEQFDQLDRELQLEIEATVEQVNSLLVRIVDLNQRIAVDQGRGLEPNDLLDQRDQLVNELAELSDVTLDRQGFQQSVVLLAQGGALAGSKPIALTVKTNPDGSLAVHREGSSRPLKFSGGKLAGLLDARNELLAGVRDDVNRLAGSLIQAVDQVHATGVGLAGSFDVLRGQRGVQDASVPLSIAGLPFPVTAGDVFIGVTDLATGDRAVHHVTVDPSVQSLDDFAAAFTAVPQLQATVNSQNGTLTVVAQPGFQFDFAPLLETHPDTSAVTGSTIPSLHGNYTGDQNEVYTFTATSGGVVGVDANVEVEVRDADGGLVRLLDVGLGYEPGQPLDLGNGVGISFASGTLNSGDTFSTPVLADSDTSNLLSALGLNSFFAGESASTITVNPALTLAPDLLATSRTGEVGDEGNVRAVLELRDQGIADLQSQSFTGFYDSLVTSSGTHVRDLQALAGSLETLDQQLQNERASISGVDPNEELVLMLQYQRSFQAAARYISAVDETLSDLMRIVG